MATTSRMYSIVKSEAFHVLEQHSISPEQLLSLIQQKGTIMLTDDETKHVWEFVLRHRNRLHLLAKTRTMKNYEEIYCKAH